MVLHGNQALGLLNLFLNQVLHTLPLAVYFRGLTTV